MFCESRLRTLKEDSVRGKEPTALAAVRSFHNSGAELQYAGGLDALKEVSTKPRYLCVGIFTVHSSAYFSTTHTFAGKRLSRHV